MPLAKGIFLLDRYRIDELLGAGGMGAVYYAWDMRLNRGVALKENVLATVSSNEQFAREAQTLARLRHNHLPAVHDYFILPTGAQYLVMEYIEGYDLAQVVKRYGPLPEARVLVWTEQICSALAYLHSQQPPIIHRDIKPQNLKLTPRNEIFLVDLGLTKVGDAQAKTVTGAQGGTPGYSPLEQYGMGGTDPRSDLYALGATLYTLLTGQVPPESIARVTEMQALVPTHHLRPDVTPALARAIEAALEVRPTQRPQSVAAFQALLRPSVKEAKREPTVRATVTQQRASGGKSPVSGVQSTVSDIARLPFEPEIVLIPAGEFLMGSDPQKDKYAQKDEQPQHKLYLPDYYIAKTPVTNAQYATFVRATGYKAPEHWQNGEIPVGKEAHPVVHVSWDDAMTYCEWLSGASSKSYTLPSEAEWEKAARGTDGRIYPWDNMFDKRKCNVKESGIGGTTPVDKYPQSTSSYGILDMAGNVLEWTRSLWDNDLGKPNFHYPYRFDDGRENLKTHRQLRRVVRGGAFDSDEGYARCAFRLYWYPICNDWHIGFRVCVVSRQE